MQFWAALNQSSIDQNFQSKNCAIPQFKNKKTPHTKYLVHHLHTRPQFSLLLPPLLCLVSRTSVWLFWTRLAAAAAAFKQQTVIEQKNSESDQEKATLFHSAGRRTSQLTDAALLSVLQSWIRECFTIHCSST